MAAAWCSAPFSVLNYCVDLAQLSGEPGEGWTRIKCASKRAYGCGSRGQKVVEGLALHLRLGDEPVLTSSLAIRMSDEALESIRAELELHSHPNATRHSEVSAAGCIQIADQRLLVLMVLFQRPYCRDLFYYIVFDGIDASLSLIKYLPDRHEADGVTPPLPVRTVDGPGYELLVTARSLPPLDRKSVICVCTPATMASDGLWQIKGQRFAVGKIPESFRPDVVFSFQGKAFWADLSQGLAFCDPHSSDSVFKFDFIPLPEGYVLDLETMMNDDEPRKVTRTMGCVGDSIWFVCIDRSRDSSETSVLMWTLDLDGGQWRDRPKTFAKKLRELSGFWDEGLPQLPPEYPVLTADGALCVLLPDLRQWNGDPIVVDRICIFDLNCERLLYHGCVEDYRTTEPVFLPSNFFQEQRVPRKRKLAEHLLPNL
ncbi:hypothetical protein ACP70R_024552 [Stipagrostis hirtigluma subsp. patula]